MATTIAPRFLTELLTSGRCGSGSSAQPNGDLSALERGASLLLFEHEAEEVIYLGPDDALDRLVLEWARRLVGVDPSDEAIWERAARRCSGRGPSDDRRLLRGRAASRTTEGTQVPPGGNFAHRRNSRGTGRRAALRQGAPRRRGYLAGLAAHLWQESDPLVRQVGSRTFISPGELGAGGGGVALFVDDAGESLRVDSIDRRRPARVARHSFAYDPHRQFTMPRQRACTSERT